ncbi:Serine/threonine-protein kinase SRPK [Glycine soja]|uniref:non-specific serine/threonine protein kinase n=1 Tax=Glycine soja TaxID=3848 RepID=A0A445F0P2_GLYSO|nr:Serine/threonine-protein kinase SRPK [Glycine soja]
MSKSCGFGMTGPLDESISCFLIRVDPWVLVPITIRGLHVLALRGLHALTLVTLTVRGLHVLALRGLHAFTLCTSYPHRQRTTRPHHQRAAHPRLQRTSRPRLHRATCPHLLRATRPRHQRTARPLGPSRIFLQKAVASGGSNLARLGELGGKHLPYFAINRGGSEEEKGFRPFFDVLHSFFDLQRRYVALKVQKSAQHYTKAAMEEITILQQIMEGDPNEHKCVVKLFDHFKHCCPNGQHVCMVFEYLGDNLLTLIKYSDYRGMPIAMVKDICFHILAGLDYWHPQLSIIHTDLKPENILLLSTIDPSKDPRNSGAPLILPNSKDKMAMESAGMKDTRMLKGDLVKNHKKKINRATKQATHECVEKEGSEGVEGNWQP